MRFVDDQDVPRQAPCCARCHSGSAELPAMPDACCRPTSRRRPAHPRGRRCCAAAGNRRTIPRGHVPSSGTGCRAPHNATRAAEHRIGCCQRQQGGKGALCLSRTQPRSRRDECRLRPARAGFICDHGQGRAGRQGDFQRGVLHRAQGKTEQRAGLGRRAVSPALRSAVGAVWRATDGRSVKRWPAVVAGKQSAFKPIQSANVASSARHQLWRTVSRWRSLKLRFGT